VADDAGALLVRSGLVSANALEAARERVAEVGGTIGEQLVAAKEITDEALTEFYTARMLVPRVNPNTLARLPAKIVASIPSDMAIELRAVPVSLDDAGNLTVAMSDPSDGHAVDEIGFFTGNYIVRAVATQLQIAWCLAHYYGHVTHLGKRLLQPNADKPAVQQAISESEARSAQRKRGVTGQIQAARHHAIVPGTSVESLARPAPVEPPKPPPPPPEQPAPPAPPPTPPLPPPSPPAPPPEPELEPKPSGSLRMQRITQPEDPVPTAVPPPVPRAKSVSGEIRVPKVRAASIKPPLDDDPSVAVVELEVTVESGPTITIEADDPEPSAPADPAPPEQPAPRRRRIVQSDPPELAARAGEVDIITGQVRKIDLDDEPAVVIADDASVPQSAVTGEIESATVPTEISITAGDEPSAVVIHDRVVPDAVPTPAVIPESQPILLDRRRPSEAPANRPAVIVDESGPLVLPTKRAASRERQTRIGIGVVSAATRPRTPSAAPEREREASDTAKTREVGDDDPTQLNQHAAPASDDGSTTDVLAAPPAPLRNDDSSPYINPPGPIVHTPRPSGKVRLDNVRAREPSDFDYDDDTSVERQTNVMSAVELDAAIPGRHGEIVPAHLDDRRTPPRGSPSLQARKAAIDHDPVDDGWGPPGTTIPPPLLGAIPGNHTPPSGIIPLPNIDSAPLVVAPPSPPETARGTAALASPALRVLEDTMRSVLELIRTLEHAQDRDEVIALLIRHLSDSHHRAGFFAVKSGELSVFAMSPRPVVLPTFTLRLNEASTLQDVVGTRLPYRGPMHDLTSRNFLAAVLGACPPEILLVPVIVRERAVGVLFGEHRLIHTFDDQLGLVARAAGHALERILKARRG
jgi:hypothetical protein